MKWISRSIVATTILVTVVAPTDAQMQCWSHFQATGAPFSELDHTARLRQPPAGPPSGVTRFGKALMEHCAVFADTAGGKQRVQWDFLPAAIILHSNSKYPRPQVDGLRWSGRGLSTTTMAGAAFRWGYVSAVFAPVLSFQQNEVYQTLAVVTPEMSPYSSYYHPGAIDLPQRFGASSFWQAHPGQSFIRVDAFGAAVGFSTENMRWGPARRNPLLMSGGAPGFPHAFVGTSVPVDVRIGHVGVEAIWGRLDESDFFDNDPTNDTRLFAGLVASFSPKHSGLTLGFTRAYLRAWPVSGLSLSEQIFGPYTGIRTNPQDPNNGDNQLLSVFLTWLLPESGFELYGEYARDDHWEDGRDLLMELDHSRAYTLGIEKVFVLPRPEHMLRVAGETTTLSVSNTYRSGRGGPTFYTHGQLRQGYTHRGQLLGAPIGPGSDAQYIAVDYLTPEILGGVYVERVRYDADAYYTHFAQRFTNRGHDAEWTVGVRGAGVVLDFQVVGEIGYSTRYNRDLVELRNTGEFTRDSNLGLTFGFAWLPRMGAAAAR